MKAEFLEVQVKKYNIKNLNTGDLIKFESDIFPIIYHYGIIDKVNEELFIFHNQNDYLNKSGGSLIRQNFNNYAKGRKIISVEKTNLDRCKLSEITEFLKDKRYHFVNNNCEHFINYLKSKDFKSPQIAGWALSILIIGTFLYFINKRK